MRLVPEDNNGKIMFFTTRVGPWADHAAEIGTTVAEIAALDADVAEAREALLAQRMAQDAARSATQRLNRVIENMARRGSTIVQQIRTQAAVAGDAVYALASIPPPADPAPIAPPGTPNTFTIALQQVGWLTLRWKCKNPRGAAGTMYHVQRSIDGGPMQFLAATGERAFIDATVPPGSREIIYQVRGVRSTAVGDAAQYPVSLNGEGMRGIPVMQPSSRKAALIAA